MCALAGALYGLHRLTTLELGRARVGRPSAARMAVYALAFAPMAFFLSAVYSESLYLALSIGLFWSAREGRWGYVGLLGALASATRSTGVVLLVPALILYLYGPRRDRAPDRPAVAPRRLRPAAPRSRSARCSRGSTPRYRLRPDALWLALVPAGLVLYGAYLGASGGDALAPLSAQGDWSRHFAGPYVAVWDGLKAAFEGARQLLSMQRVHLYFPVGGEDPFVAAEPQPDPVRVPGGRGAGRGGRAAQAAAGLRGVPAGGARAAALLSRELAAADVAAALPAGAVPAVHLAGGLARPPSPGPAADAGRLGALMVLFGAQFATWHWVA